MEDKSSFELEGAIAAIVYGGGYEVSVRCSESEGGCEAMLRYMDVPVVSCTRECREDQAFKYSGVDLGNVGELILLMERLVRVSGIPLIGWCRQG